MANDYVREIFGMDTVANPFCGVVSLACVGGTRASQPARISFHSNVVR